MMDGKAWVHKTDSLLMNKIFTNMKFRSLSLKLITFLLLLILVSCSGTGNKSISIFETTDIHGIILPYDFIEKESIKVSMASAFSYIKQIRTEKDATILLD